MEEFVSFGGWIRQHRRQLDMTQQELADRVHCSVNTIKKIETDSRRPSRQLADLLSLALGVPQDQRSLFVDVARGTRSVDLLARPDQHLESSPRFQYPIQPTFVSAPVSKIFGRETELNALMHHLQTSRLVTITGPGGIGKFTLAQALMSEYELQGQRVVFVPLDVVNEAGIIPQAIATALGLIVESDPKQQVLDFLRTRKTLLVMDNFEHVLAGATFVADILHHTAATSILTTTRERLRLNGEQVFPLDGLSYPDSATSPDWDSSPAYVLFLTAARRIVPGFMPVDPEDVLRICRITGGLPLALEMAAAWVDVLSLNELIAELDHNLDILTDGDPQTPSRHRSMRSVFDASWRLLDETERDVFSKLCVFRGGFTRQAAQAVANATPALLAVLVRRSMLKLDVPNGRYLIHELLRRYGVERRKHAQDFTETQKSHFHHFLKEAEAANVYLHTSRQFEFFERLDADQDNIRAALSWSLIDSDHAEHGAQLVMLLCWYWRIRSRVVEARQWLEKVFQINLTSVELKAGLHFHAGHFGWMQNDIQFARLHQQASLALWESMGEMGINGSAYSHQSLGMIAGLEDDLTGSNQELLTSISLFEKSNDAWGLAFSRMIFGDNAMWAGDLETAEKYFQDSEGYFRKCDDDWMLSLLLGFYGWMQFQRGNNDRAKLIAQEAYQLREKLGHAHSVIDSIDLLAQIAVKQQDLDTARQLITHASEIADRIGNRQFVDDFKRRFAELDEV